MDFALNLFIIIVDQLMLFSINIIVARSVGEVLFGNYSVATNGLLLIATMITLGIDAIIAYYVPKLYSKGRLVDIVALTDSIKAFVQPLHFAVLSIGLFISLTIITTAMAIEKLSFFEMHHPIYMFIWGAVGISLYNIFVPLFRSINYMRTAVLLSLVQTVIYFLLSLFIYFFIFKQLFSGNLAYFPHMMLIGFITSYFITALISSFIISRSNLRKIKVPNQKTMFAWKEKIYGYTVQNLNTYVFATIPLMAIEWVGHNEHNTGLFAAVVSIISLAFIAISPIGILIGPEISAAISLGKEHLKKTMKKYLLICFSIALVITFIFAVFAPYILRFYKSNFIEALPYLYVCLINIITFSLSMPLSKMIQYSGKGNIIGAKLTMVFIFIQTVASLMLTLIFGIKGTIACYVGINILYNIAMLYIAWKIFHSDEVGKAL